MIHPHVPVRIPCYDFNPIANHTLGASLLAVRPATSGATNSRGVTGGVYKTRERIPVRPATSGATNSRGVTGGVYKTRERIHRNIADLRLLVIPTSCTRVAEYNPN